MQYIGNKEKGDLKPRQPVKVQLSRKKGLKAIIWNAAVF